MLCDVLWYAQERFKPAGVIDLATLTGAIIIGLGHENAGVFSNDDDLCNAFLKAARSEDEGAWRMPLGKAYDDQLKSRIADMKNVGGRPRGFNHRSAIPAAVYQGRHALDPSGHRGRGFGEVRHILCAKRRHRLGCDGTEPAGRGQVRDGIRPYGGCLFLSSDAQAAGGDPAGAP